MSANLVLSMAGHPLAQILDETLERQPDDLLIAEPATASGLPPTFAARAAPRVVRR